MTCRAREAQRAVIEGGMLLSMKIEELKKPLLTIITATYNCGDTVEKTILSVAPYLGDLVEYIVVDGCSTDTTINVLQKYSNCISRLIIEKDDGIYDAWNKGVRFAKGQYIAFLGGDDTLRPCYLPTYLERLSMKKVLPDLITSRVCIHKIGLTDSVGKRWSWNEFRRYMSIAHAGAFHHRRLFDRYGLFDARYRIAGDYEFLLRAGASLDADFIDNVTVDMGGFGVSQARALDCFKEVRMAKLNHNVCPWLQINFDYVVSRYLWKLRQLLG